MNLCRWWCCCCSHWCVCFLISSHRSQRSSERRRVQLSRILLAFGWSHIPTRLRDRCAHDDCGSFFSITAPFCCFLLLSSKRLKTTYCLFLFLSQTSIKLLPVTVVLTITAYKPFVFHSILTTSKQSVQRCELLTLLPNPILLSKERKKKLCGEWLEWEEGCRIGLRSNIIVIVWPVPIRDI